MRLRPNYQYKLSISMEDYGENLGKNNGVVFLQYQCKVFACFFYMDFFVFSMF